MPKNVDAANDLKKKKRRKTKKKIVLPKDNTSHKGQMKRSGMEPPEHYRLNLGEIPFVTGKVYI